MFKDCRESFETWRQLFYHMETYKIPCLLLRQLRNNTAVQIDYFTEEGGKRHFNENMKTPWCNGWRWVTRNNEITNLEVEDTREVKEKLNHNFYVCIGFKLPNI
jgi:hypothetical protein